MAIRWDPWGELAALQQDVDRLAGRTGQAPPARREGLVPLIDAYETDEGVVVSVDLPGVRPDDVDVTVEDGVLTVSAERRVPDLPAEAWLRRERPVGLLERAITLPEGTDVNDIRANFEHGVLALTIPHPPERRPHRVSIGTTG